MFKLTKEAGLGKLDVKLYSTMEAWQFQAVPNTYQCKQYPMTIPSSAKHLYKQAQWTFQSESAKIPSSAIDTFKPCPMSIESSAKNLSKQCHIPIHKYSMTIPIFAKDPSKQCPITSVPLLTLVGGVTDAERRSFCWQSFRRNAASCSDEKRLELRRQIGVGKKTSLSSSMSMLTSTKRLFRRWLGIGVEGSDEELRIKSLLEILCWPVLLVSERYFHLFTF